MAGATPANARQDALRGKPNRVIEVPPESRRRVLANEREQLIHDVHISTGCDVVARWSKDHGEIYRFEIFSSGLGLNKAIRLLNDWVSQARKRSEKSSAWAKLETHDADKWYYDEVERLDEEWSQQFKGPVPEAQESDPIRPKIKVPWPEELSSDDITPRSVFGNKLERLNEIRMRDKVWITLLPTRNGTWQVEIQGFHIENVEKAEVHFQTLIARVQAENLGVQNKLNMILDETEGTMVALQRADEWWPGQSNCIVPRLLPWSTTKDSGTFREEGLHSVQLSTIQHSIKLALELVRHKKGSYDFAVRMGCIALSPKQFQKDQVGKTYKKQEFMKAVNSRAEIIWKEWIFNDKLGKRLVQRLIAADDLLELPRTIGSWGQSQDNLEDIRPTYRGTWVFRDPSNPTVQTVMPSGFPGRVIPQNKTVSNTPADVSSSLIVVQVDWIENEEGLFEKTDKSFFKLEARKSGPKANMDINLIELGESKSWYFALESKERLVPKMVSPVLTGFADRVAMKAKYDPSSSEPFAKWDPTPTVQNYLHNGRLDKIYTFGVQGTCYQVEAKAMWHPQQQVPCWGLAIRHSEWAIHLAELERLRVGNQAAWGNAVSTFLPEDGVSSSGADGSEDFGMGDLGLGLDIQEPVQNGLRILIGKILELSKIVKSIDG